MRRSGACLGYRPLARWFMRLNPSPAQINQSGTNGRYTFMGDLNPFAVFHSAPPACPA
jgi:hypothetical protein